MPFSPSLSLSVTWSVHPVQSGPSPLPFPRSYHTVTATTTGNFLLFGGYSFNICSATSDLYLFSTRDLSTSLLQTSGAVPQPRLFHGAVLINNNTLLIYGGTSSCFGIQKLLYPDSLYLLNLVSREWSRVVVAGPEPNGRHGHTTAVVDSKLFVFGGHTGTELKNDMWTLDLNLKSLLVWESYELTPGNERPVPRSAHVSVVIKDRIIIFGGRDNEHYYNDTWSFDIPTRKWTEIQCTGSVPSPRAYHAAVVVDDVMYVFGGLMGITYFDELVALQLSTQRWFKFDNVGPSPFRRKGHAMTFDGTRVFVIGGYLPNVDPKLDKSSLIHVFVPKDIEYPDPEPNTVNPNGSTELETRIEQQLSVSLGARDQRIAQLADEVADLQASLLSRDQQYEKELANVRAKFEANESKLVAVQSRLTDIEKDLAESKAEAVTLRAQAATGSVNRDENRMTRMVMELMERMRSLEAGTASKDWNEKSIESMECRNED